MLNRSKQAAKFSHIWTWHDHNKVVTTIEETRLEYRGVKEHNIHLQDIIHSYEKLMDQLHGCKNITSVRSLCKDFYIPETSHVKMKKLKVYLSGAVEETSYRAIVKKHYGDQLFLWDPIEREDVNDPNLVDNEKQAIESSDIIVAFIRNFTCGTIMELQYAFNLEKDIPIYVITQNKFVDDIWLKHHTSRFFPTIRKCFEYIIKEFKSDIIKEIE